MNENEKPENNLGILGVIPDFFHDIIAYIIPGYTLIALIFIDIYITEDLKQGSFIKYLDSIGFTSFFLIFIVAYVIGRFFEHLGYMTIHKKYFLFKGTISPKWSLLFDNAQDSFYTQAFRENLLTKIKALLEKQGGEELLKECKEHKKDDYFNLVQFYLRERFPSIALYEKKQNATIVLTRSLSLIFLVNAIITIFISPDIDVFKWPLSVLLIWLASNLLFAFIFYRRFLLDKKYHAMYIFESFIATKKLLAKAEKTEAETKQ